MLAKGYSLKTFLLTFKHFIKYLNFLKQLFIYYKKLSDKLTKQHYNEKQKFSNNYFRILKLFINVLKFIVVSNLL